MNRLLMGTLTGIFLSISAPAKAVSDYQYIPHGQIVSTYCENLLQNPTKCFAEIKDAVNQLLNTIESIEQSVDSGMNQIAVGEVDNPVYTDVPNQKGLSDYYRNLIQQARTNMKLINSGTLTETDQIVLLDKVLCNIYMSAQGLNTSNILESYHAEDIVTSLKSLSQYHQQKMNNFSHALPN